MLMFVEVWEVVNVLPRGDGSVVVVEVVFLVNTDWNERSAACEAVEVVETTPGEVVVDVEEVVILIGISVLVAEGVDELGVVSFSAVVVDDCDAGAAGKALVKGGTRSRSPLRPSVVPRLGIEATGALLLGNPVALSVEPSSAASSAPSEGDPGPVVHP